MDSSIGFNDLIWFMGIVENENDAAKQGRVQVRCFGIHPPAASLEVLTEDLPWAPVINAGHGGSILPTKGDWVWGTFMDGRDAQHPLVIGIIPGSNAQLPTDSGSSDPYTKASKEAFDNYGLPPMPKPQAGEDLETTQLVLQNASLLSFPPAVKANEETTGRAIKEPGVPFSTQPHKNAVWKSRNSSSYIQVSEGEGQEHIVLSHESGSHVQIDKHGNVKIKSFGDSYAVSEGHQFEGAKGSKTISVEGDYTLKCASATIEVEGDLNHTISGNYNLNVGGQFAVSVGQSFDIAAMRMSMEGIGEHFNIKAPEKIKFEAGDNISISAGANIFLQSGESVHVNAGDSIFATSASDTHYKSGADFKMTSGSGMDLKAGSTIYADGSTIRLNEGGAGVASDAEATPESAQSPKVEQPVLQRPAVNKSPVRTSPVSISAGDIDDQED